MQTDLAYLFSKWLSNDEDMGEALEDPRAFERRLDVTVRTEWLLRRGLWDRAANVFEGRSNHYLAVYERLLEVKREIAESDQIAPALTTRVSRTLVRLLSLTGIWDPWLSSYTSRDRSSSSMVASERDLLEGLLTIENAPALNALFYRTNRELYPRCGAPGDPSFDGCLTIANWGPTFEEGLYSSERLEEAVAEWQRIAPTGEAAIKGNQNSPVDPLGGKLPAAQLAFITELNRVLKPVSEACGYSQGRAKGTVGEG